MWPFRLPCRRHGRRGARHAAWPASARPAIVIALVATLVIVVTLGAASFIPSSRRESVTLALPDASAAVAAQRESLARLSARYVAVETLAHGEDIGAVLRRLDLDDPALRRALRREARAGALRTVGAGDDIQLHYDERHRLRALVALIDDPACTAGARRIALDRAATGRFVVSETFQPHDVYWRFRSGEIGSGFFSSMARAEVPGQIVAATMRLFRDRIDFRHGFRPGDAFRLIYEQRGPTRTGRLLAIELQAKGEWHRAVWHPGRHAPSTASRDDSLAAPRTRPPSVADEGRYLTFEGAPLHARSTWHMPVRAPRDDARISSPFGLRVHPLLGHSWQHNGIDLAAPRGAPVVAAAAGTIAFAGWRNGYGRLIVVHHAPPHSTYYAHLDSFASGIREGQPVARGQAIGRVGSTGAATGPHLHFELRVAGLPVDPAPALRKSMTRPAATALQADALRAFQHATRPLLAQIARMRPPRAERES